MRTADTPTTSGLEAAADLLAGVALVKFEFQGSSNKLVETRRYRGDEPKAHLAGDVVAVRAHFSLGCSACQWHCCISTDSTVSPPDAEARSGGHREADGRHAIEDRIKPPRGRRLELENAPRAEPPDACQAVD
eukprot:CAMPEP_0206461744 /NCGR_PEP_ID=MMETSP0324_2-20121206/25552_1 /ASSEMBLY_ACC=CAM_ASM_000836 /TAXON_ID=2866 /ORGANISM="Crypthecodinium cohnii, Strain Seligo" /LENGTH=132 /DNA_ID=CAMNT_0053933741 /DNA_START=222 /DNA_END=621 /DNA_ORIENTATION=+